MAVPAFIFRISATSPNESQDPPKEGQTNVNITLHQTGAEPRTTSATIDLPSSQELAELRWFLDDFPKESFSLHRAKACRELVRRLGDSLYEKLTIGPMLSVVSALPLDSQDSQDSQDLDNAQRIPQDTTIVTVDVIDSTEIDQVPWEILESADLAVRNPGFDLQVRRIVSRPPSSDGKVLNANPIDTPAQEARVLNILLVVARPLGAQDVDYRNVSSAMVDIVRNKSSQVIDLDIIRPGTWEKFEHALSAKPTGHYKIVHFDVHGVVDEDGAHLLFETDNSHDNDYGRARKVHAAKVATTVRNAGVHFVIMSSCNSASTTINNSVSANLSRTLLQEGLQGVIGMGYAVHIEAARLYLRKLYEYLLEHKVSAIEAAHGARTELQVEQRRTGAFGSVVKLDDWIIPSVYEATSATSDQMHRDPTPVASYKPVLSGEPSIIPGVQYEEITSGVEGIVIQHYELPDPQKEEDTKQPEIIGREPEIYTIEQMLLRSHVLLLTGFVGVGKSHLMKHLMHWWISSDFVDFIFHVNYTTTRQDDYQYLTPSDLLFTLRDHVGLGTHQSQRYQYSSRRIIEMPSLGYGSRFEADPSDLKHDLDTVVEFMKQHRWLVIVENIDRHNFASFNLWSKGMLSLMKRIHGSASGSKSFMLLTSCEQNLDMSWGIGRVNPARYRLQGLDQISATTFASKCLQQDITRYTKDEKSRHYLSLALDLFQRHPLAMQNMLKRLVESQKSVSEFVWGILADENLREDWFSSATTQFALYTDRHFDHALNDLSDAACTAALALLFIPSQMSQPAFNSLCAILDGQDGYHATDSANQCQLIRQELMKTFQDLGIMIEQPVGGQRIKAVIMHPQFGLYFRSLRKAVYAGSEAAVRLRSALMDTLATVYFALAVDWTRQLGEMTVPHSSERFGSILEDVEYNWPTLMLVLRHLCTKPLVSAGVVELTFEEIFEWTSKLALQPHSRRAYGTFMADVAEHSLQRLWQPFEHTGSEDNTVLPWWKKFPCPRYAGLDGAAEHSLMADDDTASLGSTPPPWAIRRMIKILRFQRYYYQVLDRELAWSRNQAIIGICDAWTSKRYTILQPPDNFLMAEACSAAASLGFDCRSHLQEGLLYQMMDLPEMFRLEESQASVINRSHDSIGAMIHNMLSSPTKWVNPNDGQRHTLEELVGNFALDPPDEEGSEDEDRHDEHSSQTNTSGVLASLQQALDSDNTVEIVESRRRLCSILQAQNDWEGILAQLHLIQDVIAAEPAAFDALSHELRSISAQLENDFVLCYKQLDQTTNAFEHYVKALRLFAEAVRLEKEGPPPPPPETAPRTFMATLNDVFNARSEASDSRVKSRLVTVPDEMPTGMFYYDEVDDTEEEEEEEAGSKGDGQSSLPMGGSNVGAAKEKKKKRVPVFINSNLFDHRDISGEEFEKMMLDRGFKYQDGHWVEPE